MAKTGSGESTARSAAAASVLALAAGPEMVRSLLAEFGIDALYHGGGLAAGRAYAASRESS